MLLRNDAYIQAFEVYCSGWSHMLLQEKYDCVIIHQFLSRFLAIVQFPRLSRQSLQEAKVIIRWNRETFNRSLNIYFAATQPRKTWTRMKDVRKDIASKWCRYHRRARLWGKRKEGNKEREEQYYRWFLLSMEPWAVAKNSFKLVWHITISCPDS